MQEEIFTSYYCYKKVTCVPGGEKVCGVNRENKFALFKDVCYFYGINCRREAHFLQTGMAQCRENATIFYGVDPIPSSKFEFTSTIKYDPNTWAWLTETREPSIFSFVKLPATVNIDYTLHV